MISIYYIYIYYRSFEHILHHLEGLITGSMSACRFCVKRKGMAVDQWAQMGPGSQETHGAGGDEIQSLNEISADVNHLLKLGPYWGSR